VALFPRETLITGPREWAEAEYSIVRWTEMPRGGQVCAACEGPQLLSKQSAGWLEGTADRQRYAVVPAVAESALMTGAVPAARE
jgi:hypothetical protein